MGFAIRLGGADDLAEVARIALASPGAAQWPEASYEALLNHERRRLWIVDADGGPAGFLLFDRLPGEDAEILNLAVQPTVRRRGVGRALLERLRAETEGKIFLEVRASNLGARAFYERMGFRHEGERKAYYHRPVEDAVVYVSDLSS